MLHTPFTGAPWQLINQHLNEQPAPLRALRPSIPSDLESLVARLLAKDPARRPRSASTVHDLLEEIHERHFGDAPPSRGIDATSEVYLRTQEATDGVIIPLRFTFHKACPTCSTRQDDKTADACTTCDGEGRLIHDRRTHQVRIPAGIKSGQKVRLREFGGPGKHGGAPGDLYVTVHVDD